MILLLIIVYFLIFFERFFWNFSEKKFENCLQNQQTVVVRHEILIFCSTKFIMGFKVCSKQPSKFRGARKQQLHAAYDHPF